MSFALGAFAGVEVSGMVAVVSGVAIVLSVVVAVVAGAWSVLSEDWGAEGCGVCGGVVDGAAGEVLAGAGGVFEGAEVFAGAWAFAATERVSKAVRPRCVRERMAGLLVGRFPAGWAQLNMFLT
jgi:hypothetical protein